MQQQYSSIIIMFMWSVSMEMYAFHEHGMCMLCIVYVPIATYTELCVHDIRIRRIV